MKCSLAVRAVLLASLFAWTLGFTGCSKADDPPLDAKAEAKADAKPTPAPSASSLLDGTDISSDKLKNKADKTIKALNGFLKSDDPRLETKLQKLVDKIGHDKDNWRKKLKEKRDELQPQIEQLKERVASAEGKSKAEVDRQLATLEAQSRHADKKLAELEGATGDAWKKFKARLKEDEAKGDVTDEGAEMPPSPTPTP